MARKTLSNPADRQEIVERLKKIQPTTPRRWGRMSAHSMVCHLADSFRVTMGEKPCKPFHISVTPIPVPHWVLKWFAFDVPLPWPRGLKTRPEVDQEAGGTPPVAFEADRQELHRLLDRFTHQPRDFEWQPHPIFGMMADGEWMRWGYLHMDHHLRQFGVP